MQAKYYMHPTHPSARQSKHQNTRMPARRACSRPSRPSRHPPGGRGRRCPPQCPCTSLRGKCKEWGWEWGELGRPRRSEGPVRRVASVTNPATCHLATPPTPRLQAVIQSHVVCHAGAGLAVVLALQRGHRLVLGRAARGLCRIRGLRRCRCLGLARAGQRGHGGPNKPGQGGPAGVGGRGRAGRGRVAGRRLRDGGWRGPGPHSDARERQHWGKSGQGGVGVGLCVSGAVAVLSSDQHNARAAGRPPLGRRLACLARRHPSTPPIPHSFRPRPPPNAMRIGAPPPARATGTYAARAPRAAPPTRAVIVLAQASPM